MVAKVGNTVIIWKKGVKDDPLTLFTWEDEPGGKRRKRDTDEEFSSKVTFYQNCTQNCQILYE